MIQVYRSDTGQYVLVHSSTESVIIDENLENAHERMRACLKDTAPEEMEELDTPFNSENGAGRTVGVTLLIVLILLPLVWIGGLKYALSGIEADVGSAQELQKPSREQIESRLEKLEADLTALSRQLETIQLNTEP